MRVALVLPILLVAATARAEEVAPPPVARPDWMWTIGGLVRQTSADAASASHVTMLEEYGYRTQAPALTGLRGDLAYLNAPIVDVGVAWAWASGTYASGPLPDDPDQLTGSTLEAGLFARVHWVRPDFPVSAEPRLELGVARTDVELRGARSSSAGTYTRVGVDFRMGGRRAGALLSVDYTSSGAGDGAMVDLPTGGVTYALSFYWRRWP